MAGSAAAAAGDAVAVAAGKSDGFSGSYQSYGATIGSSSSSAACDGFDIDICPDLLLAGLAALAAAAFGALFTAIVMAGRRRKRSSSGGQQQQQQQFPDLFFLNDVMRIGTQIMSYACISTSLVVSSLYHLVVIILSCFEAD